MATQLPLKYSLRVNAGVARGYVLKVAAGTASNTGPWYAACTAETTRPIGISETSASATSYVTAIVLGPVYAVAAAALSPGATVICNSIGRVDKQTAIGGTMSTGYNVGWVIGGGVSAAGSLALIWFQREGHANTTPT